MVGKKLLCAPSCLIFPNPRRFFSSSYKAFELGGISDAFSGSSPPIRLPVVEEVGKLFPKNHMAKVNLSAVIHALPTMVPVFDTLISLGLDPKNTFVAGKHNSECAVTKYQLKSRGIAYLDNFLHPFYNHVDIKEWYDREYKIIKQNNFPLIRFKHGNIADIKYEIKLQQEKGLLSGERKIIEGESTASGEVNITNRSPFPVLSYAKCALKKFLEAPLIAEQLFKRFAELCPEINKERLNIGIVGFGAIGKEWVKRLDPLKHNVMIYDPCFVNEGKKAFYTFCRYPQELVNHSDYIFVCSPKDFTAEQVGSDSNNSLRKRLTLVAEILLAKKGHTRLFNCSSDRTAFSLFIKINQLRGKLKIDGDPLETVTIENDVLGVITLYRGGFPFNFTKKGDGSDLHDIQLTRAMLIASILLQQQLLNSNIPLCSLPRNIMLDPYMQKFIVKQWIKHNPNPYRLYSKSLLDRFGDVEWIMCNSGGSYYPIPSVEETTKKFGV